VIRVSGSEDAVVGGEDPAAVVPDLPVKVAYGWPSVGCGTGSHQVQVPVRGGSDYRDAPRRFGP
jgi:hypothetical protein